MRRPFHVHASARLDALLDAKAKQGVQVCVWDRFFMLLFLIWIKKLLFSLLLFYNQSDT